MTAHSPIAPSSAGTWAPATGCTGWRAMNALYPEDERSEAAEQGTAAHELAERMVNALARAGVGFPLMEEVTGTPASNGVIFDAEMYEAAQLYAELIGDLMRSTGIFGGDNLGVERLVHAPSIHPQSYGTVDCFLYDGATLHIFDFKYGFGPVEVFENWQLMNYAAGIMDTLGQPVEVSFNIVQPRAYHAEGSVRNWTVRVDDLQPFFQQLQVGAALAMGDQATTHSGAHCRYCAARHACPAAVEAGLQLYEVTRQPIPVEMATQEMALAYAITGRALAHIRALSLGFEEQLKARARSGESIPGFNVVPVTGNKKWNRPYPEILKLGEMFGKDLRQKKFITPNQAKDLGVNEDVINAYSERSQSGVKLVSDETNKLARKVFSS